MMTRYFTLLLLNFCTILLFSSEYSGNETPFSTVSMHLKNLKDGEYNVSKSAKAFKLKSTKESERNAVQLKQILDGKGIIIKLNDIPDIPDYVDSSSRKSIYVLSSKLPQVYLEKIGNNWYYSEETVNAIPKLHKLVYPFGSGLWVKLFPYKSGETFLQLYYWQWIGFAGIIIAFILTYLISKFISFLLIKLIAEKKISKPFDDLDLLRIIANSFSLVIGFVVFKLLLPTLLLSTKLSASLNKAVDIVAGVVLIWYCYNLVEFIMRYAAELAKKTPSKLDDQLVQVLKRFSKIGVVVFGVFYLLKIFDVNVTTILAGISIGGLAIALAAQDTVKNFIGSLMIFADKPFRIGDTIAGTGFEGVVEEVGFRSTRIKTPLNSIVTVANGKLADMTIDNKGYKLLKIFKTEIMIPYETPIAIVEQFIQGIRTILAKYPFTQNATVNVFLVNLQPSGITISVSYNYNVKTFKEELEHREVILMYILKLADVLGIKMFEQNQQISLNQEKSEKTKSSDDINHELERFFVEFETNVIKK